MHNLFHYTGTEALAGILTSKQLWATDGGFLNDASEGTIPRTTIDLLPRKLGYGETSESLIRDWMGKKSSMVTDDRFFATCFCGKSDLLSQWRGYSRGNTGYALGFDRSVLASHLTEVHGVRIQDCRYFGDPDYKAIEAAFMECKGALDEEIARLAPKAGASEDPLAELIRLFSEPTDQQSSAVHDLLDSFWRKHLQPLIESTPFLKIDSFREECETRLVVMGTTGQTVHYRTNHNYLIPHLKLDIADVLANGGLRQIIIGPSTHPYRAAEGVRHFIRDCGLTGVRVSATSTPLSAE